MARKPFSLNKSTLGARAIFLLIKGSRAAVNAQEEIPGDCGTRTCSEYRDGAAAPGESQISNFRFERKPHPDPRRSRPAESQISNLRFERKHHPGPAPLAPRGISDFKSQI
jgi:hypothetical protein